MLMNVQKRCLQEGKHQHQAHRDGNEEPHSQIVTLGQFERRHHPPALPVSTEA
jgi:hypothetical protein